MAVLCLDPLQQFFDNDGNPLARGLLYTYDAVTLDELAVYTETTGVTPHANPIELDSAGRPPSPIFFTEGAAFNLVLKQLPEGSTFPADEGDAVTIDTIVSFAIPSSEASASSTYFDIEFFKGGTPTAGELIYALALGHAVDFSANWAGSVGVTPTTPPAAEFVVTIKLNGDTVGTATCSTLGTWTFATSGGAVVEGVTGDELKFYGPASEGTIEDVAFTLVGTVA